MLTTGNILPLVNFFLLLLDITTRRASIFSKQSLEDSPAKILNGSYGRGGAFTMTTLGVTFWHLSLLKNQSW